MIADKLISLGLRITKKEFENMLSSHLDWNNFYEIDQIRDSDIVIAGYPKSGNTWMQSLVAGILYGIDTQFLPDSLAQEIVPDLHCKKYYKRFSDITFFKSHHLPKREYRRVIYLSRDGRDVMLSYWHFNKIQGMQISFEDFVLSGKGVFPAKWHEHVESWCENKYSADILFVRYEDLLINTIGQLKKICEFAGINREDEMLEKVAIGCSFRNMQKKEKKCGFDCKKWRGDGKSKRFFRKGMQGEYKEKFPPAILKIFEDKSKNALKLLSYL